MQTCFEQVKLWVPETGPFPQYLLYSKERCYSHPCVAKNTAEPYPQKRAEKERGTVLVQTRHSMWVHGVGQR